MKVKPIAIVGAGGFGKEVLMLLEHINIVSAQWQILGFYDDVIETGTLVNGYSVLGSLSDLNSTKVEISVAVAVGDSTTRSNILNKISNTLITFPVLVHPSALLGSYIIIGEGTIITANNIITVNIKVGKFVILNLACTVGHDAVLEDFTSFMPSVNVSGGVIVREGAYVGTGAQILNHIEIGAWTKIGAGAVVKESLPAHCTAVGVPAITVRYHENKN